jgi:hypothetical protein
LVDRKTGLQHTADGGRNAHATIPSSHTWTSLPARKSLHQHSPSRFLFRGRERSDMRDV